MRTLVLSLLLLISLTATAQPPVAEIMMKVWDGKLPSSTYLPGYGLHVDTTRDGKIDAVNFYTHDYSWFTTIAGKFNVLGFELLTATDCGDNIYYNKSRPGLILVAKMVEEYYSDYQHPVEIVYKLELKTSFSNPKDIAENEYHLIHVPKASLLLDLFGPQHSVYELETHRNDSAGISHYFMYKVGYYTRKDSVYVTNGATERLRTFISRRHDVAFPVISYVWATGNGFKPITKNNQQQPWQKSRYLKDITLTTANKLFAGYMLDEFIAAGFEHTASPEPGMEVYTSTRTNIATLTVTTRPLMDMSMGMLSPLQYTFNITNGYPTELPDVQMLLGMTEATDSATISKYFAGLGYTKTVSDSFHTEQIIRQYKKVYRQVGWSPPSAQLDITSLGSKELKPVDEKIYGLNEPIPPGKLDSWQRYVTFRPASGYPKVIFVWSKSRGKTGSLKEVKFITPDQMQVDTILAQMGYKKDWLGNDAVYFDNYNPKLHVSRVTLQANYKVPIAAIEITAHIAHKPTEGNAGLFYTAVTARDTVAVVQYLMGLDYRRQNVINHTKSDDFSTQQIVYFNNTPTNLFTRIEYSKKKEGYYGDYALNSISVYTPERSRIDSMLTQFKALGFEEIASSNGMGTLYENVNNHLVTIKVSREKSNYKLTIVYKKPHLFTDGKLKYFRHESVKLVDVQTYIINRELNFKLIKTDVEEYTGKDVVTTYHYADVEDTCVTNFSFAWEIESSKGHLKDVRFTTPCYSYYKLFLSGFTSSRFVYRKVLGYNDSTYISTYYKNMVVQVQTKTVGTLSNGQPQKVYEVNVLYEDAIEKNTKAWNKASAADRIRYEREGYKWNLWAE